MQVLNIKTGLPLVAIVALSLSGSPVCTQQPEGAWRIGDQSRQPKVTVVVGNLLHSEGGPRTLTSPLNLPFGVDFGPDGDMIIVELEGGRVFKLTPDGTLTKIAGDGSKSYQGDGGLATGASFNMMHNVVVDPEGNIYIADTDNNVIRMIDKTTGSISTFAGTGQAGFSGDGGRAILARFDSIISISLNPEADKMYLADIKNIRVRVIDMNTHMVTTVAGTGIRVVPFHGAKASEARLVDPRAVAVDSKENIYILERNGHALRRITNGRIFTVAGTGEKGFKDGLALESKFAGPKHLCIDDQDRVFIADDLNRAIRMYDPESEQVTTVLGRGRGIPAVTLKRPHGVCFDRGKLYVVDSGNHRILRLD